LSFGEKLVAIFDNLMSSAYQVHIVLLQKSRDHIRPKSERDASVILAPSGDVLVWIGPEKITKQTAIRDLYLSARVQTLSQLH
jgi:hypothetical protein